MNRFATFDFQVNEFCSQSGLSLKDALAKMKSAGYSLLDADLNTLTEENQQIIDDSGIAVDLIYVAPDYGKDPKDSEEKILERCRRARANFLMLIPKEYPEDQEASVQRNFECIRALTPKLAELNVVPVMEDFGAADKSYRSPEGLRRYLDNIPGMKCCFDTGNFRVFNYDLFDAYELFRKDIVHVHLKDFVPGEKFGCGYDFNGTGIFCGAPVCDGILGLDRILRMLIKDGYRGTLAMEHAPMFDQWAATVRSAENVTEILKSC